MDLGSESLDSSPRPFFWLGVLDHVIKQSLICRAGIVIISSMFPGRKEWDNGYARGLEFLAPSMYSVLGSHKCPSTEP